MILRELDIDGFGVFAEQRIGRFGPGLNVVYGANEAGKSTLLAFVRALLFGFPDGRSRDNAYLPARGGAHGGRLLLETGGGEIYRLERRPGPRGGSVVLTDGGGSPAGERLRDLLGATSRELFRNVYAFSLGELQSFETLHGDGVRSALYGASTGVSVLALPRVQSDLERQAGELYKPNGTQPQLNTKLAEHARLESELAAARRSLDRYDEICARLGEIAAEVDAIGERTRAGHRKREEQRALLRLWPSWVEWLEAQSRLAELPPAPRSFPADAVARLEVLAAQRAERRQAHGAALASVVELEAEERGAVADRSAERLLEPLGAGWTLARVGAVDRSLLARQSLRDLQHEIAAARESRQVAEAALRSIPAEPAEIEAQVRRERGELEQALRQIGAGWTATRLRSIDVSAAARARLAEEERILEAATAERAAKSTLLASARERADAESDVCAAIETRSSEVAGTGRGWRLSGAAALAVAALLEGAVLGAPAQAEALAQSIPLDPSLAPLAAAALASLGALFLLVGLSRSRRRQRVEAAQAQQRDDARRRRDESQAAARQAAAALAEAEAERDEAEATWRDEVAALRLPVCDSPRALHAVVLPAVDLALRHLARLDEREGELAKARATLTRERESAASALRAAVEREAEVEQRWREWLRAGGLPEHLSPETALEALETIQRAAEAEAMRLRRCGELAAAIASARRRADDAAAALAETESRLAALIAAGGARDEEDLRRLAALERRREEWTQLAVERRRTMVEISDSRDAEALIARLRALSRADVEETVAALDRELEQDERGGESLRDERASLEIEQRALASSDDIARLRGEQERLETEMRELAHRWSRAAIARRLIEAAKDRFERERQPRVLRDASLSLERLTGGRYRQVRATLDAERPLEVVQADGGARAPEELSRGTQEQLYLALRFGYVQHHEAGGEALPLIMDEVLVNFDPQRAGYAADAIAEVGRRRQVLYFTCHPWVCDLFAARAPEAVQIRLADGRVA